MEINLCHGKGSCPKVRTTKRDVKIGENGNLVTLKPGEWNALVDAIKNGKVGRI